jgi:hypothetical protein
MLDAVVVNNGTSVNGSEVLLGNNIAADTL